MQQDAQLQQQLVLKSEIRILEKRKSDLLSDLDRVDASKKEEYSQYTQQIKDLQKRRTDLQEEVTKSRDTLTILTAAYDESKAGMEKYIQTHLKNAQKEADELIASAKLIEEKAVSVKQEADALLKENTDRKTALDSKESTLKAQKDELQSELIALDIRKTNEVKARQRAEEVLHDLSTDATKLQEDIDLLSTKKEALILEIGEKQLEFTKKIQFFEEKDKEIQGKGTSLQQREEVIRTREEYLRGEDILLKDRRDTLERAIVEYRAKGVKV